MALDKVKITVDILDYSNIESGDKLQYQVLQNIVPWVYNSGENIVDKTFIEGGTAPINNFVQLDDSTVLDNYGGTNDIIKCVEKFEFNGDTLIAIGGLFTEYSPVGGASVTSVGFVIINSNGSVFYSNNNIFLENRVTINDIKYHEANQSLIIGGDFRGLNGLEDIKGMFEFDLTNLIPSSNMNNWNDNGSIGGGSVNTITIRQSLGQIYFGGSFDTVLETTSNNIGKVEADFTENQFQLTNFNFQISTDLTGEVNTLYINQTGTPRLLVGGDFVWDDGSNPSVNNLVNLNSFGIHQPSEFQGNNSQGEIFYINGLSFSRLFIAGDITNYQGVTNKPAVVLDNSGIISQGFDYPTPSGYSCVGGYSDFNDSWVILKENLTSNHRIVKLQSFTADVEYQVDFNAEVNDFTGAVQNRLFIGGNFSTTEVDVNNLPPSFIQIGTSNADTAQNVFDNFTDYNVLPNDPAFSISLDGDKVVVEKIIQDSTTLYDISNVIDKDSAYQVLFESDAPSLNSTTTLLPLRTDFITFSDEISGFNRSEFNINQPMLNLLSTPENIKITKNKLSDDELNNYLNLSRILNGDNINSTLQQYLDIPRNQTVQNSNQGGFSTVNIKSFFNDNELAELDKFYFALQSYQLDKGTAKDKVLINGDKRLVDVNGTVTIPFISRQVQSIEIEENQGGSTTINQNNFNLNDITNAGEFVSYLTLDMNDYNNNVDVTFNFDSDFISQGPTSTQVSIIRDTTCSLYPNTRVIFRNSYGLLEEIYLKGNLIQSLDVEGEEYKKSIYSNIKDKDPNIHLTTDFNKTSTREFSLNTNNTYSYMNSVFEDMVNSQQIWLDNPEIGIVAVNSTDTGFDKQKEVTNGVINYTFEFKESKNLTQKFNFI